MRAQTSPDADRPSRPVRAFPLQPVLVVAFVLTVALPVSLAGVLSYRSGRRAVNETASQLRSAINAGIVDHLGAFLDAPQRINRNNANALIEGWVDARDQSDIERYLWGEIKASDPVSSMYFGNTEGGLVDAGREGAGGPLYVMLTEGFAAGALHKFATDEAGNRTTLLSTVPSFDARTRPWYTGAVEKGGSSWSDIYVLSTGQDMAIAASRPVYDHAENLLGVVSADIFVSHIATFLKGLDVGKTGTSLVMERSGLLVASSTDERPLAAAAEGTGPRRLEARRSDASVIRDAADALGRHFGDLNTITVEQHLDFLSAGGRQFLQVSPFRVEGGLDWLVLTIIPEADFMSLIRENNRTTILLTGIALLAAIAFGVAITRAISVPLRRLNDSTRCPADDNWGVAAVDGGRITEIRELATSHNAMVARLKGALTSLAAQVQEQRRIETALRESELRYRKTFEHCAVSLWDEDIGELRRILKGLRDAGITDLRGHLEANLDLARHMVHVVRVVDVNEATLRLYELESKEDLLGPLDITLDDAALATFISEFCAIAEGRTHVEHDSTARTFRGKRMTLLVSSYIPVESEGDHHMLVSVVDVTERRRAEEALRDREQKYRMLVESSAEAIFVVQGDIVKFANSSSAKMTGLSQDVMTSRPFLDFVLPEDRAAAMDYHNRRLHGTPAPSSHGSRIARASGDVRQVEISEVQADWDGKPASLVFVADVTERKRTEEALQTLQRLESIGALAGGIAHDFNNQLTGILGNISLALEGLGEASEARHLLREAEEACLVSRSLANQLLTFASGGSPAIQVVDLAVLISEQAGFAVRGTNVKCAVECAVSPLPARVDPQQLRQVVQNLVLNAVQAMPAGGTVTIDCSIEELEEGQVALLAAGRYVSFSVRDQGAGIPEHLLTRIFDPFFSTKSKGRGLGLPMCLSIVRRHGGHISVASVPGEGATFTVLVPAAPEAALPTDARPAPIAKGSGRVLIMDDEPAVAAVLARMLGKLGYESESVPDGAQALAAYAGAKRSGVPFDLVVMDMTIPGGMGGKEAVSRLKQLEPDARVIASSGYASSSDYGTYGFCGVLAKPYRLEDVSAAVGKAMAGGREGT